MPLPDRFHELAAAVNNWGRWGEDDERGTLNLLDADAVRRGRDAIITGERFSLAIPLDDQGPQTGLIRGRINPMRTMTSINAAMTGDPTNFCTSDDLVVMGLQSATHWDALAHVSYDNRLYNGFAADTITASGARHCGIDKVGTIVGRGVLLDVVRACGEVDPDHPEWGPLLPKAHAITAADLDRAVDHAGVEIARGDLVLVRTGQIGRLHRGDRTGYAFPSAGLAMDTAAWFHAHDVAAVATDNLTFEVFPSEDDEIFLPVHLLHLVEMGMLQGQNFDLTALAEACAADGRHTFFLEASPEPFTRGTGGPVNPVAIR